jgi:hypothetical protein
MKKLCVILILVLLTGIALAKPAQEAPNEDVKAIIKNNMQKLISSAESLSTEGMEAFLDKDPNLKVFMGAKSYNREELFKAVMSVYEPFKSQKLKIESQDIIVLSPESAVWRGVLRSFAIGKDDKESENTLMETWVWQKIEGEWKVVHFAESW